MGPYIFSQPDIMDKLGDGTHAAVRPAVDWRFGVQCVGLVKWYTKAPPTAAWRKGASVMGSRVIRKGTAIATFDTRGRYPLSHHGNHACFFLRFVAGGFEVLEQNVGPHPDMIHTRLVYARGKKTSSPNDADSYYVIM